MGPRARERGNRKSKLKGEQRVALLHADTIVTGLRKSVRMYFKHRSLPEREVPNLRVEARATERRAIGFGSRGLEARAGRTDIFAERGHVGSVGAHAASIHWESEEFSLFDAQSCVV